MATKEKLTLAAVLANVSLAGLRKVGLTNLSNKAGVVLASYSVFEIDATNGEDATRQNIAMYAEQVGWQRVADLTNKSLRIEQQTLRDEVAGNKDKPANIRKGDTAAQVEYCLGKVLNQATASRRTVTVTVEVFSYGGKTYADVTEAAQAAIADGIPREVVAKMFPQAKGFTASPAPVAAK